MRSKILAVVLILFLGLIFVISGFADLYIVKNQEGKIVAISNQDNFKAEYQKLGYTFQLWFKTTKETPSLTDLVERFEREITGAEIQGDIMIVDWVSRLDGNYYYIEGILENVGKKRVEYIQIKVIAYDSQKKLVTLKRGYANPSDLDPGQEADFKIMIKYDAKIKNFELRLDWKE